MKYPETYKTLATNNLSYLQNVELSAEPFNIEILQNIHTQTCFFVVLEIEKKNEDHYILLVTLFVHPHY